MHFEWHNDEFILAGGRDAKNSILASNNSGSAVVSIAAKSPAISESLIKSNTSRRLKI